MSLSPNMKAAVRAKDAERLGTSPADRRHGKGKWTSA